MASNKKKQDEKHLKILRDMVALPHNKQCFDCHQRGPTYVNMTIGSYVCTSCSGILRGLNPPQRVKSISMASFTPEEIEFLKCRGNEFCRKVFLGLYDSRQNPEPDSRDEQKIRDFMVQKYENKRWYVAPPESLKEECRRINEAALSKQPQTKPLRSLLGENVPKLVTQNNQSPQMHRPAASNPPPVVAASVPSSQPPQAAAPHAPTAQPRAPQAAKPQASGFDLLGELGGDPFSSSAPPPASSAGGGFADFSAFNSQPAPTASTPTVFPVPSAPLQPVGSANAASTATTGFGNMAAPKTQAPVGGGGGGDKYAALADLDQVFHTSSEPAPPTVSTNPSVIHWGGTPTGGSDASSGGLGWSVGTGGGGGGPIQWGGSGGGGGAPTGGPVSWNGTSAAAPVPSTMSWSSPMAVSSAGNTMYGGQPAQTANPFGGPPTSAAMPGGANPFAVAQPTMFGQQPAAVGGFGQFASQPQAFPQYSMQNGGFSGMHATTSGAFSMAQTAPASSGGFGGGWGVPPQQPTANPFMSAATQQQVPPRSSSTNPFL